MLTGSSFLVLGQVDEHQGISIMKTDDLTEEPDLLLK